MKGPSGRTFASFSGAYAPRREPAVHVGTFDAPRSQFAVARAS